MEAEHNVDSTSKLISGVTIAPTDANVHSEAATSEKMKETAPKNHIAVEQQGENKKKEKGKEKGEKKTKKAPGGNKKSDVWEHFTRKVSNPIYATCHYCSTEFKCPSQNRTTCLRNHLGRCKKYPYNQDKKKKLLVLQNQSSVKDNGDNNTSYVTWRFDQSLCRKYCARMIILDELPFKTVEHEGFRDFLNVLQPQFQIPSRPTVTRDCLEMYLLEKQNLKKYFTKYKPRVCLTTDIWSSRQNLSYMRLTAHFIDHEWTLHKRILNFCPISGHSGETIGKYVEKHLIDWGIDKVLTVTADNAGSNDLCLKYLKRRLNGWKKSVMNCENLHMRCCAHILSLVVKEGLKEVDDSIFRIRSAVKYVRSSPARLQRFKACIEQEKIISKSLVCLDVETRWNSTYLMLESALKFQVAFEMLEEKDSKFKAELQALKGVPMETDWDYAKGLMPFLKSFYMSTLRISGSLYVTSNCYFHEVFGIGLMIKKKMNDQDEHIRNMAVRMKKKYDKYWSNIGNMNMLLFIGPILDPRHKLGYVNFIVKESYDEAKADELCARINSTLDGLFVHYSSVVGVVGADVLNLQALEDESPMEVDDDPTTFLTNQYKKKLEESSSTGSKSELERYLKEANESLDNKFELLDWWRKNAARFPVMAAMAKDILAIPASTVASESVFSTDGRVLDAFRSSLTPTLVEALICSQNWLRSKTVPIEIEEKFEELESFEADLTDLPKDLSTIIVDD